MEKIDIEGIRQEYSIDNETFSEESDISIAMKKAVASLSETDNTLFLLYAELRSYRKLGKILGMSHTLVMKEIKRIRAEIIERIKHENE